MSAAPAGQLTYTETIDVDHCTRVGLTSDHTIVVEGSADGFAYARMPVPDPAALARALTRMRELRTGQITRDQADATAGMPIDDGMRKAIFAALRDHYGADLDRADRLEKLSLITGRTIWSINDLTRAEGSRILTILNTLSGASADPATRQLQAARAYIRRAARERRITRSDRDRYLAMLDTARDHAATATAALAAIRGHAITLYENHEICHDGLTGFLTAASLDLHHG